MARGRAALLPALLTAVALAKVTGVLSASAHPHLDGRSIENPPPGEWLSYGRSYDEQRFSPLDQINRKTLGKMGLAWWTELDTDRGQEATPLVHDGILYTSTAWSKVLAFDAKSGARLWAYDPKVPGEKGFDACCDVVNRGVALWGDKVYVGALDGRLIALDAQSGRLIWSVRTTDPAQPYTITGAPRAVKGKILIGNAGADHALRGYLSAYDAESGQLSWRFYMTPNPKGGPDHAASDQVMKEKVAATWGNGAWKRNGGGGNPWDAITYDVKSGLVFVGTGNAGPWNDELRAASGDNLFTASIVALRPDTGHYVWDYQTTPRDAWDYDAVQNLIAADLSLDGTSRRVIMQANKNGFFYVLDAATGQLISAEKYVAVDWAERVDLATGRPVENPMARYMKTGKASTQMPGPAGGHNWQPMAYSAREGLVYIPTQTGAGYYLRPDHYDYIEGALNQGLGVRVPLAPAAAQNTASAPPPLSAPGPSSRPPRFGELVAWDPVAQKARWRVRFSQSWHSGVLATDGGLVFHSAGHELTAYDAATGKTLWGYDTLVNPIAPPISYAIDGEQYIAVMAGYGGSAGLYADQVRRPGRLLVFKLGGTAKLPTYPPAVIPGPLDVTLAIPSKGDPQRGFHTYMRLCSICHAGGVFLPNLARSPMILAPDAFKAIVLEGALKERGMAPFRRFLKESDVENLRAYLLIQAKDPGHPVASTQPPLDHPQ